MLDHVGIPITDYKRSKAFYEKALAPLGYSLIMEVPQTGGGHVAAGFGADGKPDFWIGDEGGLAVSDVSLLAFGFRSGFTSIFPGIAGVRARQSRTIALLSTV